MISIKFQIRQYRARLRRHSPGLRLWNRALRSFHRIDWRYPQLPMNIDTNEIILYFFILDLTNRIVFIHMFSRLHEPSQYLDMTNSRTNVCEFKWNNNVLYDCRMKGTLKEHLYVFISDQMIEIYTFDCWIVFCFIKPLQISVWQGSSDLYPFIMWLTSF